MFKYIPFPALILILSILLSSCYMFQISPDIHGNWHSDYHKITVRTKVKGEGFKFVSDSVYTKITIHPDGSVSGKIGNATILNGDIDTNGGFLPPSITGVSYIIDCDLETRIFENDPLPKKNVQFWIGPDFKTSDWELRYTSGMAHFPMAFMYFTKND